MEYGFEFFNVIGNVRLNGRYDEEFTVGDGHWKVDNGDGWTSGVLRPPGCTIIYYVDTTTPTALEVYLDINFVQETEKGSGEYEKLRDLPMWTPDDGTNGDVVITSDSSAELIGEAVFKLGDPLDPNTANLATFECTLGGVDYEFVLEKTSSNPLVYSEEDGDCQVTITSHSGSTPLNSETLNVTITSPQLQQPVTCVLAKMDPDDNAFTNFTVEIVNRTPPDPTQCHSGVFYVRMSGAEHLDLDGMEVKMDAGHGEVTFYMSEMQDDSGKYISPPLLLKNVGANASSSMSAPPSGLQNAMQGNALKGGSTSIPMSATSSGGAPLIIASSGGKAYTRVDGATSPTTESSIRKPAFLGAALSGKDYKSIPSGHFDNLDKIIGRKSGFMGLTLPKLGYSSSTIKAAVTLPILQAALKNHSIFYIIAHGVGVDGFYEMVNNQPTAFEGIKIWNNYIWPFSDTSHSLTANEITTANGDNVYNLVFINGCCGADDSNGTATAYADAFNAKNYVGWLRSVTITDGANAAVQFFNALDGGKPVSEAILGITAAQSHANDTLNLGLSTRQPLTYVKKDDKIIIDNTPKKN